MPDNPACRTFLSFENPDAVARAAADRVLRLLLSSSDHAFSIALSGGETPRRFYSLLATEPFRSQIPWNRIHIFLADERHVPHDHAESNIRMIRATLADHVPIPAANIHPIATDRPPEAAASLYQEELRGFFGNEPVRFDLMVLGMGPDGHTASLFPGRNMSSISLIEPIYDSPKPPPTRLTLTLPAINQSRNVLFLVTGANKAKALGKINREGLHSGLPAGMVAPREGNLVWLVDDAAANEATAD